MFESRNIASPKRLRGLPRHPEQTIGTNYVQLALQYCSEAILPAIFRTLAKLNMPLAKAEMNNRLEHYFSRLSSSG